MSGLARAAEIVDPDGIQHGGIPPDQDRRIVVFFQLPHGGTAGSGIDYYHAVDFPLLEQPSPGLCADRLDYFLRDSLDIGLDPNGHKEGATPYYAVDDIRKSLKALVDDGAKMIQDVHDVGGGRLIASAKDADGNIIGLLQDT